MPGKFLNSILLPFQAFLIPGRLLHRLGFRLLSLAAAAADLQLQLQCRNGAVGAELCKEKATKSSRADAREGVCRVAASSFQHC